MWVQNSERLVESVTKESIGIQKSVTDTNYRHHEWHRSGEGPVSFGGTTERSSVSVTITKYYRSPSFTSFIGERDFSLIDVVS